jgi:hypothetical protein
MRTPRHLTIAILVAALLALAVAGCGGGGGDSTATTAATTETTPALSKADLIAQGDAICGEVNAAVGSAGSSETADATEVPSLYIGMVERLKGLGEPDDAAGYPEFIATADELAKVEGELKLATEREDTAAAEAAGSEAVAALEGFQTQASAYGFQNCSEGPSAPVPGGASGGEEAEEGGIEVAPEEESFEEPEVEEVAPEEVAPETGGAGGGVGEAAPEAGGEAGGGSGGVGPG